jgi:hypothetical protein
VPLGLAFAGLCKELAATLKVYEKPFKKRSNLSQEALNKKRAPPEYLVA